MGMVNQRTPDGSLTYNVVGYYTDPSTGRQVPRYEAVTELSGDAQALRDANNRGQLTLANLGADQASRAGDLLSRPMDVSSLPPRADRSGQQTAQYGAGLDTPEYSTQGAALPTYGQRQTLPSGSAGLRTGYETDFSADRKRVEEALFARLDPQLARSREDTERNLTNRGIKLGSDEYDRTMRNLGQTENDARISTILAGGQEQSRLAGLTHDEAAFGNTARQQELDNSTRLYGLGEDRGRYEDALGAQNYGLAEEQRRYGDTMAGQRFADQQAVQGRADNVSSQQFSQRQALLDALDNQRSRSMQEEFAVRNQPINEITALLSGAQVATPQFGIAQPAQMAATDISGLINQNYAQQQQAYQAKLAQQQAAMGGMFGLGSAALLGPFGNFFNKPATS